MHEAIDPFLDFNKSAEVGEIADSACDHRSDRVTLRQRGPRIRLGLLHSQRNPPVLHVHIEHNSFDVLSDLKHL
jgi:hypothetical protein